MFLRFFSTANEAWCLGHLPAPGPAVDVYREPPVSNGLFPPKDNGLVKGMKPVDPKILVVW